MSNLPASNLDEPPPKINRPSSPSPPLFSSLPEDIILDILARVPKRYDRILSRVSKNFQILVRSPDIQKLRSHLGKSSLYICFIDDHAIARSWFTLSRMETNSTENLLVSVDTFPLHPYPTYSCIIAVGPEIFFIGYFHSDPSSRLMIFDSRSRKFCQGPNMQVELKDISIVALTSGKIYVIGYDRHNKIHAEFFDLNTQTWNLAPRPKIKEMCSDIVELDRKVCALNSRLISCYNTRDGSFEMVAFPNPQWCCSTVCVIDNVLYVYYCKTGLMWFDSKLKQWRMVNGLDHLNKEPRVGIAEYNGKMAYLWTEYDGNVKNEVWCRMIALDKSEVGIHGIAEPSQLLGTVPCYYSMRKCLSLSG